MKLLLFFLIFWYLCDSCNTESNKSGTLILTATKDSCYYLKDPVTKQDIEAYRKLKIIENTFTDTVVFGFAALPPNRVGDFSYMRADERKDAAIDPEVDEKYWGKTKMFCINQYQKRPAQGELKIEYYY